MGMSYYYYYYYYYIRSYNFKVQSIGMHISKVTKKIALNHFLQSFHCNSLQNQNVLFAV